MRKKLLNNKKQKAYFIGIKGVGMTMLAQFLKAKSFDVSGSDVAETFLTDKVLRDAKIKVNTGFELGSIPLDANLIIYSTAYNDKTNPELGFIKNNPELFSQVRILSYAEALGEVFNAYQGIAVCGSHGKTTTSAWLGFVLASAGKSPNVLVGSRVPQFKGSTLIGKSKIFVAETDEYQNKLKFFNPYGVLLNNIEFDHPDFFKDDNAYVKVFRDFIKKIPKDGFLVIDNSDKKVRRVAQASQAKVISYDLEAEFLKDGKSKKVPASNSTLNYFAYDLKIKGANQVFKVNNLGEFKIKLFGRHNIKNALAVIAAARELGVPLVKIKNALFSFKGTERRAQVLGKYKEAIIIDDYAHHPTEVKATLKALREVYKNRNIITVFHPHTFTRTKALFKDFSESFSDTDELIVLNIYGSAREEQGGVSSAELVQAIKVEDKKKGIKRSLKNIKTIPKAADYLRGKITKKDLVVLLGAGDVFRVWDILNKKENK
ncbi:UDP-N-acetylmuramate--L-alanine ligase [Patescibacteria group bacterium]|nr:UDP-N-acetylmuramate--L-alanine ligase [Patescibacteria group bacterium]